MRTPQLPLEYLARASKETLESFELTRLNRAANFRKEARDVLNDWVQAEVESRLARFVLERRRAQSGDERSLSSEYAPPLAFELLSSAAQIAPSAEEENLLSFAEPAETFPDNSETNCVNHFFSALSADSSLSTQLSFGESVLGSIVQLDLFAGAADGMRDARSLAHEEARRAIARPDRVRLALPAPLSISLMQVSGTEKSRAWREQLRTSYRGFAQTNLSKNICPHIGRPFPAARTLRAASRKTAGITNTRLAHSSAAANLRPRPPISTAEHDRARNVGASPSVEAQPRGGAACVVSSSSLRSAASHDFTSTSFRSLHAPVFPARIPSNSSSFLMDLRCFSAAKPPHLIPFFSATSMELESCKIVFCPFDSPIDSLAFGDSQRGSGPAIPHSLAEPIRLLSATPLLPSVTARLSSLAITFSAREFPRFHRIPSSNHSAPHLSPRHSHRDFSCTIHISTLASPAFLHFNLQVRANFALTLIQFCFPDAPGSFTSYCEYLPNSHLHSVN